MLDYAIIFFNDTEYEVIASGRRKTVFFDRMGVKYYSVNIANKEEFEVMPKEDIYAVILLPAQMPTKSGGQIPP